MGIYATAEQFAHSALALVHPFEQHAVAPEIIKSLFFRMTTSTAAVEKFRMSTLLHWQDRAASLARREAELHDSMDKQVARVMCGKNVLVMIEMLESIGFPSAKELGHHLAAGFPIAGLFPRTHVFPDKERQAELRIEDLWANAADVRATVLASCSSSGDEDLDAKLFK